MFTEEEIKSKLAEVEVKLAEFPADDKISTREWRQKFRYKQQKEWLDKISKAKADGDFVRESRYTAQYSLNTNDKMNPILKYIMLVKFKSHIWG